jgi:methylenetetrahydrofolate reductase (NADPH)
VKDFSLKCGTSIPKWIEDKFSNLKENQEEQKFVGIDVACNLINKLQAEGVNEFHFYTLNKYELSYAVCKNLLAGKKAEKKEYNKNTNQFFNPKEIYI